MKTKSPIVITISRQLGSGGSYLGHRLAEQLQLVYVDREIVHQTAKQLRMDESQLASRDEKLTPLWKMVLASFRTGSPGLYIPPPIQDPTDEQIYQIQSEIITRIAQEYNAIIVGRGGHYILRNHPRHISIFLHADITFRQKRVHDQYQISMLKAKELIDSTDKSRARYLRSLTGQEWTDMRQYQLSIDTGLIGLAEAEEILIAAIRIRFGINKDNPLS